MVFDKYKGPKIHRIHGFAAKFPPGLPRYFIERLTEPGDIVLDPMLGSGTTLVEAMLLNRKGIGIDIDPLALLQSEVKTHVVEPNILESVSKTIANQATISLMEGGYPKDENDIERYLVDYDEDTKKFFNFWFLPKTIAELNLLVEKINQVENGPLKKALEMAFSATIIQKSSGVSLAVDLTHTRPHRKLGKVPQAAPPFFIRNAKKIVNAYAEIKNCVQNKPTSSIIASDSKNLPLLNDSVKLIVTSPPYANALDYMRAHKFSLSWLGYSISSLSDLRSRYIGSEKKEEVFTLGLETIDSTLEELANIDRARSLILAKYFLEMRQVIGEMHRVTEPEGSLVIVVGPSTARGILIPTHEGLAEIGKQEGFELIGIKEREIHRDHRQMPFSKTTDNDGIEARIHRESILLLRK